MSRISACLAQCFAERDRRADRDVERTQTRAHRNGDSRVGLCMHGLRNTGTLAAHHQSIARLEGEPVVGRFRVGSQQNETTSLQAHEIRKARVPGEIDVLQVIECGTLQRTVAHVESRRADDVGGNAKTRAEAENSPRVRGNVRLIKRQAHVNELSLQPDVLPNIARFGRCAKLPLTLRRSRA